MVAFLEGGHICQRPCRPFEENCESQSHAQWRHFSLRFLPCVIFNFDCITVMPGKHAFVFFSLHDCDCG